MWFKQKNSANSAGEQFQWDGSYNPDEKVNKELVEEVVSRAFSIPSERWQGEDWNMGSKYWQKRGYRSAFSAITDRGSQVLVAGGELSYGLFVNTELIGEWSWDSDGFQKKGYNGIYALFHHVCKEHNNREWERNRPIYEAQTAERKRAEEEQKAREAKRVKDILDRF